LEGETVVSAEEELAVPGTALHLLLSVYKWNRLQLGWRNESSLTDTSGREKSSHNYSDMNKSSALLATFR
jgi:hypothetical protein